MVPYFAGGNHRIFVSLVCKGRCRSQQERPVWMTMDVNPKMSFRSGRALDSLPAPRKIGPGSFSMRSLPRDIDVDAVLEIGAYLDDQAHNVPVSIRAAVAEVRRRLKTDLSDHDLEELIVESASTRRLSLLLDSRDEVPPPRPGG
ncbi:hypothetical protein [Mesorhizobium sp.]|uniref:hypothetical protein n=1 Tax=Mesorhizobium sp. TaxID=1871066 RepID=UPI003BA8BF24